MAKKIFLFLVVLGFFGLSIGILWFVLITKDLPNPELLSNRRVSESTKIYDRTGEVLLYEIHGEEKRTTIPSEEIPRYVKDSTIAIEDENFYSHNAFDFKSIIRAFIVNLAKGKISQGGSTITQQLAKNAFLTPERTITRKIKELVLALRLEEKFTKEEILTLYLNQISYGPNIYGVESASQAYFQKKASELNLSEAALLASLPKAPSYYSPWGRHVDELLARKNFVLEKMNSLNFINEEEKEKARENDLIFAPRADVIKAPHFVIEVQEYLNQKYGEDFIRTGGFEVITTLDWELQEKAEEIVTKYVEKNEELYGGRNGALITQDSRTGAVLALVGSKDYFDTENEGNFNVATQGLRQPGSAMKPFGYLTAFLRGFTPETIVFDLPTEFASKNPDCPLTVEFKEYTSTQEEEEDECYHPENFDHIFRGPVTFREGLSQSINVPSIKTLYLAGIDNMLELVKSLGITTLTERSRYGLSLVLGGGEIKLSELVGAYSVLANDGKKVDQTMILSISRKDTDGKELLLEQLNPKPKQVLENQYVRLINDVLSDIDSRAGLFTSSLPLTVFQNHEVALKTGTTNDYRDAWTIGYTPSFVVGVWAGNNDNTPMIAQGGSILAAVPMWSEFMKVILEEKEAEFFPRPSTYFTNKPILNNEYLINNEIHNILHYVDKKDPLGKIPVNPSSDSQYENWEEPVQNWIKENLSLISTEVETKLIKEDLKTDINIISPKNGFFIGVKQRLPIHLQIKSDIGLNRVSIHINDLLSDIIGLSGEKTYEYNKTLIIHSPDLQNKLTITVSNENGEIIKEERILYQ